jgi:predicted RNase H-like nuclease
VSQVVAVTVVLGVDGCPGGWVGALVDGDAVRLLRLPDAAAIVAAEAAVLAVDIPIGLPSAGPRACDVECRRLLGPRRASVFPAPVRAVLAARDYAEACAVSRAAQDRALSVQAWNLVPRIRDVDAVADDPRLVEVHPELAFRLLAGRDLAPKKTAEGRARRITALRGWLPDVRVADLPPGHDALDALAAAWSAQRLLRGEALVLPADPPRDAAGRPMRIAA